MNTHHSNSFAFIIDLMLQDGQVQILELGTAHQSSLSGFNHLFPTKYPQSTLQYRLQKSGLLPNDNLHALCNDKGILYALMANACPDIFPQSRLYPFYNFTQIQNTIARDFAAHEHVILKFSDECGGDGATILPTAELAGTITPKAAQHFTIPLENPLEYNGITREFWHQMYMASHQAAKSHFVVQSLITPDAITRNGKSVNPTLRIALSVSPTDDNKLSLTHHGSYYKLPLSANDDNNATLSERFISMANPTIKGHTPFARVPRSVQENVLNQLHMHFLPALEPIFFAPTTSLITTMLSSRDEGTRLAGLNFIFLCDTLSTSSHETPQTLITLIDNLLNDSPAATFYLARMCSAKLWPPAIEEYQDRYYDLITPQNNESADKPRPHKISVKNLKPLTSQP